MPHPIFLIAFIAQTRWGNLSNQKTVKTISSSRLCCRSCRFRTTIICTSIILASIIYTLFVCARAIVARTI